MQIFSNIWVASTLALYYFGPIEWSGRESIGVAVIVLTSLLALNVGFMSARGKALSPLTIYVGELLRRKAAAYAVVLAFFTLSAVTLYGLYEVAESVASPGAYDLGEVYNQYQDAIRNASQLGAAEQAVLALRALLFPLALLTVCIHFRSDWKINFLFFLPMVATSMLRGTDKEMFDLVLIVLVIMFYRGVGSIYVRYAVVLIPVILTLFIERKLARYGGELPICLGDATACMDYSSVLASISPKLEFGVVMMTSYLTNGYQGLSLAFSLPFEPHYGLGHLPPIGNILCDLTGALCDVSTYNERLVSVGWDTRFRWASVYTTLADDLSFVLVPVYLYLVGLAAGAAEAEWASRRNSFALATLIMCAMFIAYSSANMQVAMTLDWSVAWIVFFYGAIFAIRQSPFRVAR